MDVGGGAKLIKNMKNSTMIFDEWQEFVSLLLIHS